MDQSRRASFWDSLDQAHRPGIPLKTGTRPGKDHHKTAVASAFIIDKNGIVQWAHAAKDYKTRPGAEQLLQIIDELEEKDE